MNFFNTPEGQDFYRMFDVISNIDVAHTLYMMEILEFMKMMQQFDDAKDINQSQREQATRIIQRQAESLKTRKQFETLVKHAPNYDFEFLPALIIEWSQK